MDKTATLLVDMNQAAAENASRALSQLIDRSVKVVFSQMGTKKLADLCPFIPAQTVVMAIELPVRGETNGVAMLILPEDFSLTIVDILTGKRAQATRLLSDLEESALKEVANVITGGYLTIFSDMTGIALIGRLPILFRDTFKHVISQARRDFLEDIEDVLAGEVELAFESATFKGYFLLLLRQSKKLLDSLA